MQNSKKTFLSVVAVSLLAVTLLAGCGAQKSNKPGRNKMPGDFQQAQDGSGQRPPRGERPADTPTQIENSTNTNSVDEKVVE
ncbi:MAG: hypothetical protein WCV72_04855 [Patescibacteria group bacterium]